MRKVILFILSLLFLVLLLIAISKSHAGCDSSYLYKSHFRVFFFNTFFKFVIAGGLFILSAFLAHKIILYKRVAMALQRKSIFVRIFFRAVVFVTFSSIVSAWYLLMDYAIRPYGLQLSSLWVCPPIYRDSKILILDYIFTFFSITTCFSLFLMSYDLLRRCTVKWWCIALALITIFLGEIVVILMEQFTPDIGIFARWQM